MRWLFLSIYLVTLIWTQPAAASPEPCKNTFEQSVPKPMDEVARSLRMGSPVGLRDLNLPAPDSERHEKDYRWLLRGNADEIARALLSAEKDVLNLPFFDFAEVEERSYELQNILANGLSVEATLDSDDANYEFSLEVEPPVEREKPSRGRLPFDVIIDDHITLTVHPLTNDSFLVIHGITADEMRQISGLLGVYPKPSARIVYPFLKDQALDRLFLAQHELAREIGATPNDLQTIDALKSHLEAQILSRAMERIFRKYFLRALPESDLRVFAEKVHLYLESYKNDSIFENQRDLLLLIDLVPGSLEIKSQFREFVKTHWPIIAKSEPEGVRTELKMSYELNLDGTNVIVTGRVVGEVRLAIQSDDLLLTNTFVENPKQLNIRLSPSIRPNSAVDECTMDRILQRFVGIIL